MHTLSEDTPMVYLYPSVKDDTWITSFYWYCNTCKCLYKTYMLYLVLNPSYTHWGPRNPSTIC